MIGLELPEGTGVVQIGAEVEVEVERNGSALEMTGAGKSGTPGVLERTGMAVTNGKMTSGRVGKMTVTTSGRILDQVAEGRCGKLVRV